MSPKDAHEETPLPESECRSRTRASQAPLQLQPVVDLGSSDHFSVCAPLRSAGGTALTSQLLQQQPQIVPPSLGVRCRKSSEQAGVHQSPVHMCDADGKIAEVAGFA